jgi:hypothetical protein
MTAERGKELFLWLLTRTFPMISCVNSNSHAPFALKTQSPFMTSLVMLKPPWLCRGKVFLNQWLIVFSLPFRMRHIKCALVSVTPFYITGDPNGFFHYAALDKVIVVSTPLLNLLPKQGFGCEIVNPITGKKYVFVGYAFVDNTDIIESKSGLSLSECVTGLQQVLDTWEGALKATCGAIVPEKHFGTW